MWQAVRRVRLPEPGLWVVLLGTALVYGPSLLGGWVWDDHYLLSDAEALRQPLRLLTSDSWAATGNDPPELGALLYELQARGQD